MTFVLAALLTTFSCDGPPGADHRPSTIAPTPSEETPTSTPETASNTSTTAAPAGAPERNPLVEEHFDGRPYELSTGRRLSGQRRLAIYTTPDESIHYAVAVGIAGNRGSTALLSFEHADPDIQILGDDFGPGLIRVRITSRPVAGEGEEDDRPRSRRPRPRVRPETAEHLLSLDDEGRLRHVHRTVTSSSSVASAGTTWDGSTNTLTTSVQRRNPPGRERCRRPDPITIIHTWRGDHFEETHRDDPSLPCGRPTR